MRPRTTLAAAGLVVAVAGAAVTSGTFGSPFASSAAPGPTVDDAGLFVAKGCATCHNGPDSQSPTGVGPSLVGAAEWAGERRAGMEAVEYLRQSMNDPAAFTSPASSNDVVMPVLALTEDDVDRLVAYLLDR